jgi:hypothetical protein
MKVTTKEKMFYDEFLKKGIEKSALIHFIKNVRNAPMYGSIFHINLIDKKLKKLLSDIYHYRIEFNIDNTPVRSFISDTWEL